MNKAIISGNLGKDPDIKYAQTGTAIANFSVATTETVKGEKKTEWHRCVCFGKTAENVGQYLGKGSKVLIEGKIQTRSWEQDGQTKYMTEIVANNVEFLDSKGKSQSQGNNQSQSYPQPDQPQLSGEFEDSDIPF